MESSTENLENLNETGKRNKTERRQEQKEVTQERRKVQRRRLIDPTTCERDYTNDEIEFMQAMDEYKRRSGRMFPTCSEILEVIRGMGYIRVEMPQVESGVQVDTDEESPNNSTVRTTDVIAGDLEHLDDMDEPFEDDDFEDDFDDE